MAFINEIIPEEQKDKFNFPVQISVIGRKPTLYKWVIDPEKDFFLVKASSEGGAYDGTQEQCTFYFHAYNRDFLIKANPLGNEYTKDKKIIFKWRITQLAIPHELMEKVDSLIELIVQAFRVWGHIEDGENYYRVDVEVLDDAIIQVDKEGKQ